MMIDLAKEFSPYPSGRYEGDGKNNGTRFRKEFLEPAFLHACKIPGEKVVVDIDGVRSFGSSFLEEAFAGLIRHNIVSRDELENRLEVRCTKPYLLLFKDAILSYIKSAKPEQMIASN